jgi:hypothetical protein
MPDDPLETLREQIRAATEAAEQIAREAATNAEWERSGTHGYVPPAGWASESGQAAAGEVQALANLLHTLRELLPPELQLQITELIRQLLIVLRALIDWAVTRIEREGPGREVFVEDIPIS